MVGAIAPGQMFPAGVVLPAIASFPWPFEALPLGLTDTSNTIRATTRPSEPALAVGFSDPSPRVAVKFLARD